MAFSTISVCVHNLIFDAIPLQYNCNSGGWKNIQNLKVCGFMPNTLVNCEIRARRESNSNNNINSEVATHSVTTLCPAGKYLLNIENVLLN